MDTVILESYLLTILPSFLLFLLQNTKKEYNHYYFYTNLSPEGIS